MKKYGLILAALATAGVSGGLSGGAFAQAQGGRLSHLQAGALQRFCQSPQTVKVCDAYVSGVSDAITLVETAAGPNVARDVCIPGPTTAQQMRGVLLGYLSKHPDRLSSDVGPVTYDAFKAAFPCGGPSKP
ncbi:hypothetical protein NFI95_00265 [Acetobacteraceae bacterium KSS8]|uniref:Rap1a immunity protein domain-containing protein n=1 Tax=Endosaccharibacter trunci TaxID=2812733 RepID=A0ABT1W1Y8_9PROT|nr:hypothetical protein [Acetobacteraceae bacterium KSS8]